MTVAQSLTTYFLAAAVLTMTPGVDTALVLRASTGDGPKAATGAGLGVAVGLLSWGCVVALGLGSLLAASQVAYTALRWIGAAYLCWLGLRLILKPRQALAEAEPSQSAGGMGVWFGKGMLSNLLNPKIGVFYVTFLPQFIPPGVRVGPWSFMLAAIHAGQVVLWFALIIAASVPLGRALRRPKLIKALDRLTGGVFLLFGAKLALSRK